MTRILVADDERPVVDGISHIVRRDLSAEFEIVGSASSGREAVEKTVLLAPELVLMDVRMPGMNGEEATTRIRAGGAGEDRKDIPVVALTAFAITGDKERFLAAGMDDYLSKPVDIEELNRVLARVIGQT